MWAKGNIQSVSDVPCTGLQKHLKPNLKKKE